MAKQALVGTVLALLVSATPALAQSRPFRGLFGPAPGDAEPPQSLHLTVSLFGVEDTRMHRLLASGPSADAAVKPIYYNDLETGLWYTQRSRHTTFSAAGTSTMWQFPQLNNVVRWSGAGDVGLSTRTERNTFNIEQLAVYTPFTHFRVVPAPAAPATGVADLAAPDVSLAVTGQESYRYNTNLDWSRQMGQRSTLRASYRHEYLNFVQPGMQDWRVQSAGISYTHGLTANTSFVAGYDYHRRQFQGEPVPTLHHDIQVGLDYTNTLPFSPRTTFSFSLGTTTLSRTVSSTNLSTDNNFFRLIGNADLEHQLGQTWKLGVSYDRRVQYIEGVSDVFLADTAMGSVQGFFNQRVDLRATTGYSTGALRYGVRTPAYSTAASTARLRIALTRNFALQTDYTSLPLHLHERRDAPNRDPSSGESERHPCRNDDLAPASRQVR